MKKIYLSMMFAASMCFAGNISTVASPYDVYNGFYIFNDGNTNLNGFKFYYYFNSAPEENMNLFSATVYRKQLSGSYVAEASVQPRSVHFERLSATQYRAILDFSNAVIPARGKFPVTGKPLNSYTSLAIQVNRINDNWARSRTNELRAYVVESLSGEVLVSKKVKYRSDNSSNYDVITENGHPAIDNFRRVGVLTNESSCDFKVGNQNRLVHTITLGTENDVAGTKIVQGNSSPLGVTISNNNRKITFKYCAVYSDGLPRTTYDYAVLKLDSECPVGSIPVSRYHDTEDNGNPNSSSQYIWPNKVNRDASLEYCFVSSKRGSTVRYPLNNKKYGFFSRFSTSTSGSIAYTKINVEDEHNQNADSWDWSAVPLHLQSNFMEVMSGLYGSKSTTYNVIKWVGGSLSKSAAEVADAPISVENTLVAAAPLAPTVKGLNRNAVAVDLKSAGDVKVSIVGINGAVIANIAEKSLQAGIHQIKWNAGMVPSGRYIVKVEQNGMVNAKNVILK